MAVKSINERLLFGIKVRHFRKKANLSFQQLAKNTGVSISYLNEIEKGKKYPKEPKIEILASHLKTTEDELTSPNLPSQYKAIEDLLDSNFLNELPLDLFGIDILKVIELMVDAPIKVNAFISTLVEISRNYAFQEENFYFGALRSYLEFNNNYFEALEESVTRFKMDFDLSRDKTNLLDLTRILERKYKYKIIEGGLDQYSELSQIRSLYKASSKELFLNGKLSEQQLLFQLAKEIGFNFLKLKDRASTASITKVKSFDQVISHFSASYFSAALIVKRSAFLEDLNSFFANDIWDPHFFISTVKKYNATQEVIFQRMTNLLPRFLGLKKIYILRNFLDEETGEITIDRELHIHEKHKPHNNALGEHFCRRWLSAKMLHSLKDKDLDHQLVDAQISSYHNSEDQYLSICMAKKSFLRGKNISLTIGIKIDASTRKKIRFLSDPKIPRIEINTTCERCPLKSCKDRVAPPTYLEKKAKRKKIQEAINNILQ